MLPSGYLLLAVADGMGGARGGEIASSEGMKHLAASLQQPNIERPDESLRAAFEQINRQLHDMSRSRPELQGMGTTLVVALVRRNEAWLANVGDSRGYVVRNSTATQITQDHSLVAEQLRAGYLTEEEAAQATHKNIITRCMGTEPSVQVDTFGPIPLPGGSRIVLCSDGLHGVVGDSEIGEFASSARPEESTARLVELANRRGGPDNISVVVYEAPKSPEDTVLIRRPRRRRIGRSQVAVAAGLAGAIGIVLVAVLLARSGGEESPVVVNPPTASLAETTPTVSLTSMPTTPTLCPLEYTFGKGEGLLHILNIPGCDRADLDLGAILRLNPDLADRCELDPDKTTWQDLMSGAVTPGPECIQAGDTVLLRPPGEAPHTPPPTRSQDNAPLPGAPTPGTPTTMPPPTVTSTSTPAIPASEPSATATSQPEVHRWQHR